MQLWAVLLFPPSKHLSNSQLSGLLRVNSFVPHEGWSRCAWKRSNCSGSPVRAFSAVGDSENTFTDPKGKNPGEEFQATLMEVKKSLEKWKESKELFRRQEERREDQVAGKDKDRQRRGSPDAAPSVELRLPYTLEYPSWHTDDRQNGNPQESPCAAKHRDQTEENIVLWLPKGFPGTSGQVAGACTRGNHGSPQRAAGCCTRQSGQRDHLAAGCQ